MDEELARLEAAVDLERWTAARESELEMTSMPEFWKSPERFEVLELFASRERVERALEARARRSSSDRAASSQHPPREPLQQLALRLHLLSSALQDIEERRPGEVLVVVQAGPADRHGSTTQEFRQRLEGMYRGWSSRRGAQLRDWESVSGRADSAWVASIQSFGAWSLLHPETGLHVWERHVPRAPSSTERDTLLVQVLPVSPANEDADTEALAREALEDPESSAQRQVVRRYRAEPSPLVRDTVRGWRTGRLEWVLAGDFDLIAPDPPS